MALDHFVPQVHLKNFYSEAENLIFHKKDQPWVGKFVAKNCQYRIETLVEEVKVHNETYPIFSQRISEVTEFS